jgi:hypothetical protein
MVMTLLQIAKDARQWPETKHLSDEALQALKSEHLVTLETIVPVMLIDGNKEAEAEPTTRRTSS